MPADLLTGGESQYSNRYAVVLPVLRGAAVSGQKQKDSATWFWEQAGVQGLNQWGF